MFGIGMPELILIMAIALIVIGPKKLPDLARSLGRALGEFKKATGELKSSLGVDEELGDVKNAFDEMNRDIKDAIKVDPLQPKKKDAEPPKPDETDFPEAGQKDRKPAGESPGKAAKSDQTPSAGVETNAGSSEPETQSSKNDDTKSLKKTIVKKDQGETVGDQ